MSEKIVFWLARYGEDVPPSEQRFELQSNDGVEVSLGRGKKNDYVVDHKAVSWTHLKFSALPPGSSGATVALAVEDVSSNGCGLQTPGNESELQVLQKGARTPVPNGSYLVLPKKVVISVRVESDGQQPPAATAAAADKEEDDVDDEEDDLEAMEARLGVTSFQQQAHRSPEYGTVAQPVASDSAVGSSVQQSSAVDMEEKPATATAAAEVIPDSTARSPVRVSNSADRGRSRGESADAGRSRVPSRDRSSKRASMSVERSAQRGKSEEVSANRQRVQSQTRSPARPSASVDRPVHPDLPAWVQEGRHAQWWSQSKSVLVPVTVSKVDLVKRVVIAVFDADGQSWKSIPFSMLSRQDCPLHPPADAPKTSGSQPAADRRRRSRTPDWWEVEKKRQKVAVSTSQLQVDTEAQQQEAYERQIEEQKRKALMEAERKKVEEAFEMRKKEAEEQQMREEEAWRQRLREEREREAAEEEEARKERKKRREAEKRERKEADKEKKHQEVEAERLKKQQEAESAFEAVLLSGHKKEEQQHQQRLGIQPHQVPGSVGGMAMGMGAGQGMHHQWGGCMGNHAQIQGQAAWAGQFPGGGGGMGQGPPYGGAMGQHGKGSWRAPPQMPSAGRMGGVNWPIGAPQPRPAVGGGGMPGYAPRPPQQAYPIGHPNYQMHQQQQQQQMQQQQYGWGAYGQR